MPVFEYSSNYEKQNRLNSAVLSKLSLTLLDLMCSVHKILIHIGKYGRCGAVRLKELGFVPWTKMKEGQSIEGNYCTVLQLSLK